MLTGSMYVGCPLPDPRQSHLRGLRVLGRPPRPWHIGVLYADDHGLAAPVLEVLGEQDDLCIGDNQPYSGSLPGDTMWTYGIQRGLPHVLIEVRNDLIAEAAGQDHWAVLLSDAVRDAVAAMRAAGPSEAKMEAAK